MARGKRHSKLELFSTADAAPLKFDLAVALAVRIPTRHVKDPRDVQCNGEHPRTFPMSVIS